MIKCPKCSFEQPDDIYCANCGVNMKTFRPTAAPFIKAFLGSWMGKVFLITLAIICFLVYDMQKKKDQPQITDASQAARSQIAQRGNDYEAVTPEPPPAAPTATAPAAASVNTAQRAARFQKGGPQKAGALQASADKAEAPPAAATSGPPVLRVSFYSASRNAIQNLQRESMAAPSSGEVMGGIVPQRQLTAAMGDMRSLASSRYKVQDAQKPIIIYKGQRSAEVKAGVYFQITPLRREGTSLQMEIKSWGNIKPQETDETFFTTEMTINPQQSAFIAGFLPHEKVLTEEEKTLLEGDPTLKIYNQDDFIDGSSDLIMIVELTQ